MKTRPTPSFMKKQVAIVEDQDDLRESFALIINSSDRYNVVGKFRSVEEALPVLLKSPVDIVLMDIELPGKNGIVGTQSIKEKFKQTEVVIVTVYEDDQLVFDALKAGASGYITKNSNYLELIAALDEIVRGGAPMSSRIAKMVIHNFHINLNSPLSTREKQVLTLVARGMTYTQISEELFISKETAKTHIRNIYQKLHVNSKAAAIERATQERYI